ILKHTHPQHPTQSKPTHSNFPARNRSGSSGITRSATPMTKQGDHRLPSHPAPLTLNINLQDISNISSKCA
ncbi:hypothetical protein ASPBRDRAFT_300653, partial [Aspergillus brasiliensis CBS 101740]